MIPITKRAYAMSDDMTIDVPYVIPGTRQFRALPLRAKKPISFHVYRSDANSTSDDDTSEDDFDTDLGTVLSDIEGDLDSFSRDTSVEMDEDEGQQVDCSIPAVPTSWSEKGKAVDPREHGGDNKKRKPVEDVDCDADDEDEVSKVVTKRARTKGPPPRLHLARSNLGPTKSIMEITEAMDSLGSCQIIYHLDADDYDANMVSAELTPLSPAASERGYRARAKRSCSKSSLVERSDRVKIARTSPYPSSIVAHHAQEAANRLRNGSSRLPGQNTLAKLRRTSPTSLLPTRGHRQLRRAPPARVIIGQLMLDAMNKAREARVTRRENMKAFYLNQPTAPTITARLPDQQVRNLERKRRCRDQRRVHADRARDAGWCAMRLPPPQLPLSFAPIALLSPDSRAIIEALEPTEMYLEERPASPTISEPPEYEPPPMPVVLPLPAHLRPRSAARPASNEVPQYRWFEEHFAGGQYTRRSPSPPPPFNAQTDRQVMIPVRFIDDDDEVDDGLAGLIPSRDLEPDSRDGRALATSTLAPMPMVGAFPTSGHSHVALLSPAQIIAPIARRPQDLSRSSWEAALDMEEADDEITVDGDSDAEPDTQVEETGPVLSTLSRFLRFWR